MKSDQAIPSRKLQPAAHGGGVRGDNFTAQSPLFEGRFGRLFRTLPPASWSKEALDFLATAMTADPERFPDNPLLPAAAPETAASIQDDEENSGISAGYTYFGQFIDHDITFDPASSLQQQNDPEALFDYRTPRLDLDSLYGRGPDDQPYMYARDGRKFQLGTPLLRNKVPSTSRDVPRYVPVDAGATDESQLRAIIGDKRNDENVIVSQFQGLMLQFHNAVADLPKNENISFQEIQRQVRWTYQWLVVNDFLPRLCGADVVASILPVASADASLGPLKPNFLVYHYRDQPFLPIEFSAAVYRFGHSMVRPIYRLNTELRGGDDPDNATQQEKDQGIDGRFFVFAGVQERGLNGFGAFPKGWAIDWSLFFDINGSAAKGGSERVQPAYKIDTSLVNPLGFLPEFSVPPGRPPITIESMQGKQADPTSSNKLALRNLLRGMSMGLPSGQAIAASLGLTPIADDNLRVGKAVLKEWDNSKRLTDVDGSFAGNAPLWYYVLAEAQYEWFLRANAAGSRGDEEPARLGQVGGRLVAETLIGLIYGDSQSYLAQAPSWKPEGIITVGDLIKVALG